MKTFSKFLKEAGQIKSIAALQGRRLGLVPDGHGGYHDKKTGEFLGAHLVGPEVTELIQGFAIAKKLETTEEDLMETIFPHPTLSEAMHESVLDAYGRVIHM